jgi:peroxiredoxin
VSDTTGRPSSILPAGAKAPEFDLPTGPDTRLSSKQLRGKPLVLVFYPADFSPVCGDQLTLLNECCDEFDDLGATVVGVSVDGPWCHQAYAQSRKLKLPLLSDFEPKGAVSRAYGVYDSTWGTSQRALFVVDADGIIRWSYLSPIDKNPGVHGIIAALEEMKGDTTAGAR